MTDDATVFITLGNGNDFGISNSSMFIRGKYHEDGEIVHLGLPTKSNFDRLIENLERLRCHMEDK